MFPLGAPGGEPKTFNYTHTRSETIKTLLIIGSHSEEYEADLYGTCLNFKAGFDVRGSLALQKLFIQLWGGDGNYDWIFTHPDPLKRLKKKSKIG